MCSNSISGMNSLMASSRLSYLPALIQCSAHTNRARYSWPSVELKMETQKTNLRLFWFNLRVSLLTSFASAFREMFGQFSWSNILNVDESMILRIVNLIMMSYKVRRKPHRQQASWTLLSSCWRLFSSIPMTLSTVRLSRAASTHFLISPECLTFLPKL